MAIEWRLAVGALVVGVALVAIALLQGCDGGSSATEGTRADDGQESADLRSARREEAIRDVCETVGTRPHGFTDALVDGDPTQLRLVYSDSSGRAPCGADVRHSGSEIVVTLRVADPEVSTADLRAWCAQGTLPAGFDTAPIRDDVGGAVPSPSGADRRVLESGRNCVRIPIASAD
jgi:hypothetical protein